MIPEVADGDGGTFEPGYGTAYATGSFFKVTPGQYGAQGDLFLSEAVYQFASPAQAEAFFSAARTCLIDNEPWSNGVDTAPVDGDQAVTAVLKSSPPVSG